uniref:NitT/TauT family transport system permease protein n=1 Tax=Candidatus Kentrum sp. SD TaxID=2126332 RepID=A0A450Z7A0_9GAMM|nr:MAG: NitT/TauT family transport system permease protein [Candidatus Kentron sp. SD]VFK49612.1 MAG: NitT/TauT family transport system permease protein [Candidatus Kentron sp. SD]
MLLNDKIISYLIRLVSVTFLLVLLELLHTGEHPSFLPAPSSVAKAFFDMYHDGLLVTSVIESLSRVFYGFSAALLVGLSIGYGMGSYPRFKDAVVLPLEMLRPIPPIAWIPLAIIVFGISNLSAYFVIFIGALFPILTNTELGVRQVRGGYIEAAKIYGASDLNLLRHIVLPSALPSIFSGIVIGLGFSWMVVVAAEMVAANSGLGYQIQLDRQLLRLDRVIAGMVTIGVLDEAAMRQKGPYHPIKSKM